MAHTYTPYLLVNNVFWMFYSQLKLKPLDLKDNRPRNVRSARSRERKSEIKYIIDESIGCNLRIRGHVIYYVRNLNNASIFRCFFFFLLSSMVFNKFHCPFRFLYFSFSLGFGWKPVMHMNVRMNANSPIDTNRQKEYNKSSDKIVRCGFLSYSRNEWAYLFWLCLTWIRKECFFCILFLLLRPSHRLSAYRMNNINDVDTYK